MTQASPLQEALSSLDVSNVYIYVGDAVRDDFVSDKVIDRGTYVPTIASSTHSPTSFASLVTGRYPPNHGVWSFSDQIIESVPRMFDLNGFETRFLNSIFEYATEEHGHDVDPIYSVLDADIPESNDPFQNVDSPFVIMERGPGGHAPYGDFDGVATEYFHQRSTDGRSALQEDYRRSIELDVELLFSRLEELKRRGLRDDTLVIYTSDHGELLGEGGMLGHNGPMRPELVYVPTVFVHPDLQKSTIRDLAIHHVDILPTIRDVVGNQELAMNMDGYSISDLPVELPRPCFWKNRFLSEGTPLVSGTLCYEGVWDSHGGFVFTDDGFLDRVSVFGGKLFKSSKCSYMRRHFFSGLRSYVRNKARYGRPQFNEQTARQILSEARRRELASKNTDLSDDAREHLQDLGYME